MNTAMTTAIDTAMNEINRAMNAMTTAMTTNAPIRSYDATDEVCPCCIRDRQDCECQPTLTAPGEQSPMQPEMGIRKIITDDGITILKINGEILVL